MLRNGYVASQRSGANKALKMPGTPCQSTVGNHLAIRTMVYVPSLLANIQGKSYGAPHRAATAAAMPVPPVIGACAGNAAAVLPTRATGRAASAMPCTLGVRLCLVAVASLRLTPLQATSVCVCPSLMVRVPNCVFQSWRILVAIWRILLRLTRPPPALIS